MYQESSMDWTLCYFRENGGNGNGRDDDGSWGGDGDGGDESQRNVEGLGDDEGGGDGESGGSTDYHHSHTAITYIFNKSLELTDYYVLLPRFSTSFSSSFFSSQRVALQHHPTPAQQVVSCHLPKGPTGNTTSRCPLEAVLVSQV